MLITDVVQVSGRGTSVDFTIDDALPFDQVIQGLRRYLVDNRGLWSKGNITVNAGLRIGSPEQLKELKAIIEKESGLTVARFWCSPDAFDGTTGQPTGQSSPQDSGAGSRGLRSDEAANTPQSPQPEEQEELARPRAHNEYPMTKPKPEIIGDPAFSTLKIRPLSDKGDSSNPVRSGLGPNAQGPRQGLGAVKRSEARSGPLADDEDLATLSSRAQDTLDKIDYMESRRDTALFIKSTCRSGEIIRYQGDVVVLGDVNPGAEIVAAGDITVFGALRGLAHAGSEGLTKAVIIAYRLESPRLQIGPYVGVASGPFGSAGERDKSTGAGPLTAPTIAYIRRRSIYVAEFEGRFARYSRGILYEG